MSGPFKARNGRRPGYPTSTEAVAYERAFAAFPAQPWGLPDSPAMQGWADAEVAHAQKMLARAERREFELSGPRELA